MRLLTFGHGTRSQEELVALIHEAHLSRIVDVRTTPKSRRHPWVWREEMERWVPRDAGAAYQWESALGGRRRTSSESQNIALRHAAFRGYADYMETPAFHDALDELVRSLDDEHPTAIMCSETLWWRCHRRLISDAMVLLRHVSVEHLDARGKSKPHVQTPGVRVLRDQLRYDVIDAA